MRAILRCMGFSRVESLLGLTVMAVVVTFILPGMKANLQDEEGQRAGTDAKILAHAIMDYNSDTGNWPPVQNGRADLSDLSSSNLPPGSGSVKTGLLGTFLSGAGVAEALGTEIGYRPGEEPRDPWNQRFHIYIMGNESNGITGENSPRVIVISAGSNGLWETNQSQLETISQGAGFTSGPIRFGDDIGYLLQAMDQPGTS